MIDPNTVIVVAKPPEEYPTSNESVSAVSASSRPSGSSRESPEASVSAINGAGGGDLPPLDLLSDQFPGRYSIDTLGLNCPPNLL